MPGAWVWLNGAINATVDQASPGIASNKQACIGGDIGVGVGPGVVFGAGVDLIPIAQAAAQKCNSTVSDACSNPIGKAANCAVESFLPGDINACQAIEDFCSNALKTVENIVHLPANAVMQPFGLDS